MAEADIIARVLPSALDVDAAAWNRLLEQQSHPTAFMRHEYLAALESSGVGVASVTVARVSLDDVYLRHTGRTFQQAESRDGGQPREGAEEGDGR